MELRPGGFESGGHLALRPALGQHDLVPELVQSGQVAAIETDRELSVISGGQNSDADESGRCAERGRDTSDSSGLLAWLKAAESGVRHVFSRCSDPGAGAEGVEL